MNKKVLQGWLGEGFWVGVGLGGSVLALLVGTRCLTTLLSPREYGRLALSVSLATLAVQFGATPIAQTVIRFYTAWREQRNLPLLLRWLGVYLSVILAIILFIPLIMAFFGQWFEGIPKVSFLLLVAFFAVQMVINRVAFAFEDAVRARRVRAILQVTFEVGRFAFAVSLVFLYSSKDAATVLLGFCVVGLLTMSVHLLYLKKQVKKDLLISNRAVEEPKSTDPSSIRNFVLPLIVSYGCIWIFMMAERWALRYFGGLSDVGGYAAVYQLAYMPMMMVSNFVLILSTPIIYQFIGADQKTESLAQALAINRYLAIVILIFSLLVFLFLIRFHPLVGKLLLGPEFRHYSRMFPWLLLAGGCFAASQQLLLKLTCEFRTGVMALLWVAMAIISISAYIVCAYFWRLSGIFAAVVSVNGLLLIVSLALSWISWEG